MECGVAGPEIENLVVAAAHLDPYGEDTDERVWFKWGRKRV